MVLRIVRSDLFKWARKDGISQNVSSIPTPDNLYGVLPFLIIKEIPIATESPRICPSQSATHFPRDLSGRQRTPDRCH